MTYDISAYLKLKILQILKYFYIKGKVLFLEKQNMWKINYKMQFKHPLKLQPR